MAISGETILITGASSGIGQAVARQLAQHNKVIAVGRNKEALDALNAGSLNIHSLVFDVSDSSQIETAKNSLGQLCTHLDRVILNAGDCIYLQPKQIDWSIFERMMAVNFFGWINSLQLCLDLLDRAKHPHIVGIASQVIHAPFSRAEAYGASKAAAAYFLRSLALDFRHKNIDCSVIYPGFVDTPLTRKNRFPMPLLMQVDEASMRILFAIEKRRPEYSFPRRLRYLLLLSKLFPAYWNKKFAYEVSANETE